MTSLKIAALGLLPACLGIAALISGDDTWRQKLRGETAVEAAPAEKSSPHVGTIILKDGSRCHKFLVDYGSTLRTDAGFVPCFIDDLQARRDEIKDSFRRAFSNH